MIDNKIISSQTTDRVMQVIVRVNGILAQKMGLPRLMVTLPERATVQDLQTHLQTQYPHLSPEIQRTVAVIGGSHRPVTAVLKDAQEIALLLPVAGG